MALAENIVAELGRLLGPQNVLTAPEDLIPYSFDGTAALRQTPGCVAFATGASQVADVLRLANTTRTPVVPRGSGTGLSGGSLPCPDCLVLCTVRMANILELDRSNLTILVEPGVTTVTLAEAAMAAGLFYPPDPGSMKISTIGGNVAENSGGLRGLKYGVTRNYVMGLEVVLPTGEILWLGNKCVKDVAGYSLKDVFIGSEGTLGIITKVLLRLIPKPAARKTLVATFDQMDKAAEAVSAIIAAQIIPCTLEFLDRTTIRCVEDYARIGLPLDCEALLLMESDGHAAVVAEEAARMERICREHGLFRAGPRGADHHPRRRHCAAQRTGRHDPLRRSHRQEVSPAHRHLRPHGRRQPPPHLSDR
jgi:glycolate dehydrogenase FAD-linked subunit